MLYIWLNQRECDVAENGFLCLKKQKSNQEEKKTNSQ
jgi:hypothetical protein